MDKNNTIVPAMAETESAPTQVRAIPADRHPQPPREADRPGPGRARRIVRRVGLAAAVLAGASAISLGGAVGASAEPAPAHSGWDGSKYWFKNSAGAWRWTTHYDVYLSRIGGGTGSSGGSGSGGIKQGWDGSKYWFKNSAGAWRWTTHYDVYLSRIGGGTGSSGSSGSGGSSAAAGSYEAAVQFALGEVGLPFIWGGNGPDGYDCSGLVQQAYRRAGVSLPRVANDQYAATTPISSSSLRRGDLLFWSVTGKAADIEHVAIYLGNNQYVEAARPGTKIRISTLSSGYYPTHLGRP
ncbi:C40 family peptidase [Kitasatospora sp. NBC_00374]|uniref:C40 family peptidase n=1 Tax=Kitasatospora sp. NBC_00374 TaxID=2975964 RepID=UPI0032446112